MYKCENEHRRSMAIHYINLRLAVFFFFFNKCAYACVNVRGYLAIS